MDTSNETRRVVRQAGYKHIIIDSATDRVYHTDQGLAFALGVACIEAETVRDFTRFWKVCHPNGTELYHVAYMPSGEIIMRKMY